MKRNPLAEQGGFDLPDSTERRFARNIMKIDVTEEISILARREIPDAINGEVHFSFRITFTRGF